MKNAFPAIALLCLGSMAQATVNIEAVAVGNVSNAPDDTGYGSVGYKYNIGKYEVTAGQYTAFLNAVAATDTYGLYNTKMNTANYEYGCNIKRTNMSGSYSYSVTDDWANRPVNFVSYWDSCRFANWLGNGQPIGMQGISTTERGAYTLDGYNGTDGRTIGRSTGAKWAVTSEDEWYKAAYYKSGGTTAGYWHYPTMRNTAPANHVWPTDPGNSANYNFSIGIPYYRTNVGEFENSASAYGTFDQGGNVWEWNEAIMSGAYRGLRGGSFNSFSSGFDLSASYRYYSNYPNYESYQFGFRVSEVPEPSSLIAAAGGLISLLGTRRRKA